MTTEKGFPAHILDATLTTLSREAERPRWLAGLVARHGEPLIVRRGGDAGETRYEWDGMSVRIGRDLTGVHYAMAVKGNRTEIALSDSPLSDADVSGEVAAAGLCDAGEVAQERPPAKGEFCHRHFSWLCQAGQGKCQSAPERAS